jgi:hypothetical protein
VIARDVVKGDVEPRDEVLEVVERKVAATENQVDVQRRQPVSVERFVDLVGDGEDASQWPSAEVRRTSTAPAPRCAGLRRRQELAMPATVRPS